MEECAICNDSLYGGHKLDCGHTFHENCIELCQKDNCPLCRRPFNLIADIYVLEICFYNKLNKMQLFYHYPKLKQETFQVITKSEKELVLYFQFLERRDKRYQKFCKEEEIQNLQKFDKKIDVRKCKHF